jgi:peptidoglycan/LPS O-acetylase OafA/YrhL
MKKSHITGIRWFARILGAFLVLFVLLSAIGGIIDPPPQAVSKITTRDMPLMIGMAIMLLGIIIAWFREGIGGLLVVGGFIFFVVVELITDKNFDAWFLLVFLAVGLLHLFCWRQSKNLNKVSG